MNNTHTSKMSLLVVVSLTSCVDREPACAEGDDCAGQSTTSPIDDSGMVDSTGSGPVATTTTTTATTTTTTTSDSTEGTPLCAVNSQCALTERCDEPTGECVDLRSTECDIVVWPESGDRDNVEFVGSIFPTGRPWGPLMQPNENGVQLAVEDFNSVASLHAGQKIAWVGCDSAAGSDAAVAAAEHLVETVGAHAIVGPALAETVERVVAEVAVPTDTFLMSPLARPPVVPTLADNDLVWHVVTSNLFQGHALIDRFTEDLSPPPARLLVLSKDDAYGDELLELIATELVSGLAPSEVFFSSYPDPGTFATQEDLLAAYGEVLGLALSQPGIATSEMDYDSADDHYTHVLVVGTGEAQTLVLSYLGIWAQLYSYAPLPLFTVTDGAVPHMGDIVESAAASPSLAPLALLLQTRLRGTSPMVPSPENYTAFNIRYQIRFNAEDALVTSLYAYDAAFATFLSMMTVTSDEGLSGPAIASGMARLVDPEGIVMTIPPPEGSDGLAALTAGESVNIEGVSGPLDWNLTTGELRSDVLGWSVEDAVVGGPAAPTVDCIYTLFPESEDGVWVSASDMKAPCN